VIVSYRTFTSEDGQVRWVQRGVNTLTQRGYPDRQLVSIQLGLFLHAATQADLTTAINNFESAFGTDGGDLHLYLSDGATESAHTLLSSETITGIRVVQAPSYPGKFGAEYAAGLTALGRYVQVGLQAEINRTDRNIKAWTETVEVIGGGGGEFVIQTPLQGPPVRQEITESSPIRMIQEGYAIGYSSYPTPPNPLSPSDEHLSRARVKRFNPRETRGTFTDYKIAWHREMEKVSNFGSATPNNATD